MSDSDQSPLQPERLQRHYEVIVATYRQQADLYIKSFIAYLVAVGGAGGYYFTQESTRPVRVPLLMFIVLASLICLAGTVTGFLWVRDIERILRGLERRIDDSLPPLPLYGGRVLGVVATLGTLLILGAALFMLALG